MDLLLAAFQRKTPAAAVRRPSICRRDSRGGGPPIERAKARIGSTRQGRAEARATLSAASKHAQSTPSLHIVDCIFYTTSSGGPCKLPPRPQPLLPPLLVPSGTAAAAREAVESVLVKGEGTENGRPYTTGGGKCCLFHTHHPPPNEQTKPSAAGEAMRSLLATAILAGATL